MHLSSSSKGTPAAGTLAFLAAAFAVALPGAARAEDSPAPATAPGNHKAEASAFAQEDNRHPAAEAPLTEEQRKAVLDLAAKFSAKAESATQDHMARVDDPPSDFPFALMKDVAVLNPPQLHLLLRTIGGDKSIRVPNRSVITGMLLDAWTKRPENKDPQQVRPLLECLFEFTPGFGAAWDALPFTGIAKVCIDWNAEASVDFVVEHWSDWPKVTSGYGISQIKNTFLGYIRDPKQRARLEALQEPARH